MAEHELGHAERARELFNQGTTLIQEQRDRAPGGGVPPGQGWLEWAIILRLQARGGSQACQHEVYGP